VRKKFATFLALSLAAIFSSVSAHAQSPYGWTGIYAGGSIGFGWGNSGQTDTGIIPAPPPPPCPPFCPVPRDGHYSIGGGLIGGTLGYNRQSGPWVFGVETDYSWADIKGHSDACGLPAGLPCGTKMDSFGTARARIGIAMEGVASVLPYLTGGLAFGDVHGWDSLTPASGSKMYTGWTAGAGIEWQLRSNWAAKIEYLYADLGKHQLFDVVPGLPETVSAKVNIVRIGMNYKFGN
jgi:outer membrane immunogenic protein